MNIALDMMGGDFAPEELVKGVRDYLSENKPALVSLIGDEQLLTPLLNQYQVPASAYHCGWFRYAGSRQDRCFYQRRKHRCDADRLAIYHQTH